MTEQPPPPADAAGAPVDLPAVADAPTSLAERRRARGRLGATLGVGALVVASLGFAVSSLTAADGAATPEAAVQELFEAIDQEDAIGVVEALEPTERDILRAVLEEAEAEAGRVGLTDPSLDLGDVEGVDIVVEGLATTTVELAEGVVGVDLTAGEVRSAADLDAMPAGRAVREAIDRERAATGDEGGPDSDRIELAGTRMVAVDTGDGWRVSVLASVAENLRLEADGAPGYPAPSAAIAAVGAADPEAVVRDAIEAATDLDVARLIELTPAEEDRVLHTYGSLLVDAAEDDEGIGYDVSDLSLSVSDLPDGRKLVRADTVTFTWTEEGWGTETMVYEDGCTTTSVTYDEAFLTDLDAEDRATYVDGDEVESYRWCDDDLSATPLFGVWGALVSPGSMDVVVEEHDGAWFLSPTRTLYENTFGMLRDVDEEQMRRLVRAWSGEWWLTDSAELWEACGVAQPGLDVPREEAEQAADRCYEQLPEDYAGPWGFPFGGWYGPQPFADDEQFEILDGEDGYDPLPEDACFGYGTTDPPGTFEELPTPDEVVACLADLVAEGTVDPSVLAEYRCSLVFDDLPELTDEQWETMTPDELDEWYAEAEAAYDACLAEGPSSPEGD